MPRLSPVPPLALVITVAGVAFLAQPASALDVGSIDVSAEVVANCSIVGDSSPDLVFGDYDPGTETPTDTSVTFSVQCSTTTDVTVALDAGGAAPGPQRHMTDLDSNTLDYDLYQDAPGGIPFGDGTALGQTKLISVGAGGSTPVEVHGRIPDGQTVPTGSYTDSVTISLTFL